MNNSGLEIMLAELEAHRLEVILVPSRYFVNDGGCVRVAISKNATWYRRFCAKHPSSRRRNRSLHDTCIKRMDTIRLLERLIAGLPTRSKYAEELMRMAESFANCAA